MSPNKKYDSEYMLKQYNFEIIVSALNCPHHKEQLQPNGNFGCYWCKHPEYSHTLVECHKERCPIIRDKGLRVEWGKEYKEV